MEKPNFVSMLQPGDEVCRGKYRLARRLGEGTFGEVFAAENIYTGGRVALKMLRREWSTDQQAILRLRREAQAANRVVHRNVVRILDIDQHETSTVLVMELLQGETLADALPSGQFPLHTWVALLVQAMRGVAAVHKQGVVHRDIKPENIFLAREEGNDGSAELITKVLDFGISKLESGDSHHHTLTRAGTQGLGSPHYMSPEQFTESSAVDQRTDVYAFGVVLYEALTGHYPYEAEGVVALMWKVTHTEPIPPSTQRPEIPESLSTVVLRAMAKRPEARFQNLDELIQALVPYMDESAFSATAKRQPHESFVRRIGPVARVTRVARATLLGSRRAGAAAANRLTLGQPGSSHARLGQLARLRRPMLAVRAAIGDRRIQLRLRALRHNPRRFVRITLVLGTSLTLGVIALKATPRYKQVSCRWGNADACMELAVMYRDGRGVAGNNALAEHYVSRACEHGAAAACPSIDAQRVAVQVFSSQPEAVLSVSSVASSTEQTLREPSEDGSFNLQLRPGRYHLELKLHDRVIAVDDVVVTQDRPLAVYLPTDAFDEYTAPPRALALVDDVFTLELTTDEPTAQAKAATVATVNGAIPTRARPVAARPTTSVNAAEDPDAPQPNPFTRSLPSSIAATPRDKLQDSEALANLSREAFEHPYDPDTQYALGLALRSVGDLDGALLAFTHAAQLPPKTHSTALLQRTLAETLEAKGDLAHAIATMRQSLSAAKHGARHCSGPDERYLVRLLVKQGKLDEAVAFVRPLHERAESADEAKSCKAFLATLVRGAPHALEAQPEPREGEVLSNPYRAAAPKARPATQRPLLPENPY